VREQASVTVAIHPLDPIAAAKADIAGSKSLMAAVADDLSQHERWFAHYRLAEKRHARRVMLQELIYQFELARKRTMRFLRRTALLTLRLARHVAALTARTAAFVFISIRDAVIACIDWLRPRAIALALLLRQWLVASWIWLAARSRAFATLAARWGSAAWAWTRVNAAIASSWIATISIATAAALRHWLAQTWRRTRAMARVLTRQSVYGARIALPWIAATLREAGFRLLRGLTWTAVNVRLFVRAARIEARRAASWSAPHAQAAALALKRNLSEGAAWSAAKATQAREATAHASMAATARMSQSWVALKTRHASNGLLREVPPATSRTHRALVVRRSTAIICFEPRRSGLSAPRAG
jgi:hypothetical protein